MTEANRMMKLMATVATATLVMVGVAQTAQAESLRDKWCSNVHIRFFVGGAEGDAFGTIVYNGALQAAHDTGANVDYVFSGWDQEKMIQQLREAVAAKPDGIAMMGHPGNAAIMPLAEEASKAGIKMIYQNVPVDDVTAKFGGAYVGAQQHPQGVALGEEAIRRFGLQSGDVALVMGGWAQIERSQRELGTVDAFEKIGMTVVKLDAPQGSAADPNMAIPIFTAAIAANPGVKLIAYPGGQLLGNVPIYMQAAGKKPGEIINIGFDTSPQVVQAFADGWVQLTSDQQPFQQGYLPILSLCEQVVYGLGGMNVDTGAGFVTPENYKQVADLATQGLR
ncbi:MAG: substrate-binding domain-containing protein [bacterium]